MNWRLPAAIGAIAGGCGLLWCSFILLQGHFAMLKDVREYALPLAADIPPLERRLALLGQQTELSGLEANLRSDSAEEQLRTYVLPQGGDTKRLLAFLESAETFLQNRQLLQSMSAIDVGDPADATLPASAPEAMQDGPPEQLQTQTIHFSATLKPDGREQLLSILQLSGMLTVGDVLTQDDIKTLFTLTENQNYAAIVPVEQFLSADLLAYTQNPILYDSRLSQALPSEDFLNAFHGLLQSSALPQTESFLTGDLGRTLVEQKLWPVQFLTIEKESLQEMPDGWENVDLTLKAYSRKS